MNLTLLTSTALAALVTATPFRSHRAPPSDPVGVYAVVDKVVLLPTQEAPTEVEIWGALCVARGFGDYYTAPAHGCVVFRAASKPDEAVQQWRELAALAGTRQVIGFSSRHEQGDVRVGGEGNRPAATTYPLSWGLHRVEGVDYGPVRELRLLPKPLLPSAAQPPKARVGERRPARQILFEVENCPGHRPGMQYVFTVETASGDRFASGAVIGGEKTTTWETRMALTAGDRVMWRVHVHADGKERVPVAVAEFVVGTDAATAGGR